MSPRNTPRAAPEVASAEFVLKTGVLAHDINNLLTVVLGYASLLARGLDKHDPRRADAMEIVQAAQQAGSLAHQLLVMSGRPPRLADDSATPPAAPVDAALPVDPQGQHRARGPSHQRKPVR